MEMPSKHQFPVLLQGNGGEFGDALFYLIYTYIIECVCMRALYASLFCSFDRQEL